MVRKETRARGLRCGIAARAGVPVRVSGSRSREQAGESARGECSSAQLPSCFSCTRNLADKHESSMRRRGGVALSLCLFLIQAPLSHGNREPSSRRPLEFRALSPHPSRCGATSARACGCMVLLCPSTSTGREGSGAMQVHFGCLLGCGVD